MEITSFLSDELCQLFGNAIMKGFKVYTQTLEQYPALVKNSGKQIKASILHAFTEESIAYQISTLPNVTCISSMNSNRSYTYLEVILKNKCILTTSRVRKDKAIPRVALYRQKLSQGNPVLFEELYPSQNTSLPYVILIHGIDKHGVPFAGIGMPESLNTSSWYAYVSLNNLLVQVDTTDEEVAQLQRNVMPKIERITGYAT